MKERALKKIQIEIQKEIDSIVNLSSFGGLGELMVFASYLHFTRLIPLRDDIKESEKPKIQLYVNQLDEAYKYLIQRVYKFGNKSFVKRGNKSLINGDITQSLVQKALHLNNNYEAQSFLTLFNIVEVNGERDQHIKLNLEDLKKDETLVKYFYYGARIDKTSQRSKGDMKTKVDFLNFFKQENEPYKDLFQEEFGVTLFEWIELIDYLLDSVTTNIHNNEDKFEKLPDGTYDVKAYRSIIAFGSSLFIDKEKIEHKFGQSILPAINRISFDSNDFDEHQLRFNLIARKPILEFDNQLFISPEILLDSLFVNSHFSLLESKSTKDKYKDRYSNYFVDRLVKIGEANGYKEFGREIELYEGKNQIGDLDLVLKNEETGHFVLIEAKNHALPLDVYFHDFEATQKRLKYLQDSWESKVIRRFNNVTAKHTDYKIGQDFDYIIVSRFPEILSHFSNFLILTEFEFKEWLSNYLEIKNFNQLQEELYHFNNPEFTEEQLREIETSLNTGWHFAKE